MFAGLTAENLSSPAVLLGFVFVLVVVGFLVPSPLHKRIVAALKEENAFLRERNKEQSDQITTLAGNSQTALHIGDELRRIAGTGQPIAEPAGREGLT